MDAVRALIKQMLIDRGMNSAELSRAIGRNHAYIQQFLTRNIPAKLPEDVRSRVAEALGVDEVALGAAPSRREPREDFGRPTILVPERDVRASAGPGTFIEEESVVGQWPFPRAYINEVLALRSGDLSLIDVRGDSMEPTLKSGDKVMVDHGDTAVSQGGVFAIFDGHATVVKRVETIPGSDPLELMLISDNPKHNSYPVKAELISVAGRVVWYGRRL
ncbi:S24 family peptidase [Kaistia sp. MMO-174]|uniref:S24 family peptidase n=1 Tax=Kaistia sp. MMO-174 TaxID=3081256 RepID=UPI00301ACBF4